jgi:hypothetical protein
MSGLILHELIGAGSCTPRQCLRSNITLGLARCMYGVQNRCSKKTQYFCRRNAALRSNEMENYIDQSKKPFWKHCSVCLIAAKFQQTDMHTLLQTSCTYVEEERSHTQSLIILNLQGALTITHRNCPCPFRFVCLKHTNHDQHSHNS